MARRPMMVVTIAMRRRAGSLLANTIVQICRRNGLRPSARLVSINWSNSRGVRSRLMSQMRSSCDFVRSNFWKAAAAGGANSSGRTISFMVSIPRDPYRDVAIAECDAWDIRIDEVDLGAPRLPVIVGRAALE